MHKLPATVTKLQVVGKPAFNPILFGRPGFDDGKGRGAVFPPAPELC